MPASILPRPANLLDQRMALETPYRPDSLAEHALPDAFRTSGAFGAPFINHHIRTSRQSIDDLQCSLMLADQGVYLSDLAPDILAHACERLRTRHSPLMLAL
jgi:hypothetical protein